MKRGCADPWIMSRIRRCILLKTARVVNLYATARRNSSIDRWRKRVSIWSTSQLSTAFQSKRPRGVNFQVTKGTKESIIKNYWVLRIGYYPNIPSSKVALYWEGISIKADRANSVCFLIGLTFFDIISAKFTNYKHNQKQCFSVKHIFEAMD